MSKWHLLCFSREDLTGTFIDVISQIEVRILGVAPWNRSFGGQRFDFGDWFWTELDSVKR
jgi:hypothetical protein